MTDIALCYGIRQDLVKCPKRNLCRRYIKSINNNDFMQSYIDAQFELITEFESKCQLYWPVYNEEF